MEHLALQQFIPSAPQQSAAAELAAMRKPTKI